MKSSSSEIKSDLIQKIKDPFNHDFAEGAFLPSVRSLSDSYHVAPLTINRLLKAMEQSGYVEAYPRQGYKIIVPPTDLNQSGVVVYLSNKTIQTNDWDLSQGHRQNELQKASALKGWPLVSIDVSTLSTKDIFEKLKSFQIVGVIMDHIYLDVIDGLNKLSVPTICLDVFFEYFDVDEISRDEFQGARIAGDYVVKKGYVNFGWIGPIQNNPNGQIRFSGVNSALLSAGKEFEKKWIVELGIDADEKSIEAVLKRANRPKVLFVFWKVLALKVAKVAESMKLKLGKDIYIIGWCTEEQFESEYRPVCPALVQNCVTVVWSICEIATACMQRIQDRISVPNRTTQRIVIAMKLFKS